MQIQELFRVLHCCFPVPKALRVNSQTGGGIIIFPLSSKSNESFFDVSIACSTHHTPKGMKMRFHFFVCWWDLRGTVFGDEKGVLWDIREFNDDLLPY